MAKYKIALMPGDGIGNDVMDAAQIVLDKIALDAEYVPADIGWEFWRTEGEPLPQRTVDMLKTLRLRAVRRHHLQTQGGGRGGTGPRVAGQGA